MLDKTWQEIHDAFLNGAVRIMRTEEGVDRDVTYTDEIFTNIAFVISSISNDVNTYIVKSLEGVRYSAGSTDGILTKGR